jgi:hypothetical protein
MPAEFAMAYGYPVRCVYHSSLKAAILTEAKEQGFCPVFGFGGMAVQHTWKRAEYQFFDEMSERSVHYR